MRESVRLVTNLWCATRSGSVRECLVRESLVRASDGLVPESYFRIVCESACLVCESVSMVRESSVHESDSLVCESVRFGA